MHVTSAVYDNDTQKLIVTAQRGDGMATLKLSGYPAVMPTSSGMSKVFTVTGIAIPPAEVNVTSYKGGADADDVVITGTDFPAAQVVASISADTTSVAVGQAVTLDGSASTGTINTFAWTQTAGPAVSFTANAPSITFTPTVAGRTASSSRSPVSGAGNTSTANSQRSPSSVPSTRSPTPDRIS